jgi:general L-amino acid transport system permease protein
MKRTERAKWARRGLVRTPWLSFRGGLLGWMLAALLALPMLWPVSRWLIWDAVFWPPDPSACGHSSIAGEAVRPMGACWPAVWDTLPLLLFGRYPREEIWRIGVAGALFIFAVVFLVFGGARRQWGAAEASSNAGSLRSLWQMGTRMRWTACALCLLAAFTVFRGAPVLGLPAVVSSLWGGFFLTIILSVGGIGFGFPFGVLLALGRRSAKPIVCGLSTAYIELIRGVPLITILFMSNYLLPLFLPPGSLSLDELLRAQVAIILFQAAYIAEVVRGGMQAVDPGQYEAARALGMSYGMMMRLIILPQALRVSAPALVSTFIGLVKDTSLVAVIGIYDLLGSARNVPSIPEWVGRDFEPLIFAAAVYFVVCVLLSRLAQRYERFAPMPT